MSVELITMQDCYYVVTNNFETVTEHKSLSEAQARYNFLKSVAYSINKRG